MKNHKVALPSIGTIRCRGLKSRHDCRSKSVHESRFLSRVFYGTRHWFCSHRTRYHCTGAPNGLCRHHSPFAAHPCANLLGLVTDCCGWSKPLRQWLLPVSIRLVFSIPSDSALPILFMLMNTDFKLAEANICLGYLFQIQEYII